MLITLLITIIILLLAMALLGVRVLCKRHGQMSSMHIHDSAAMRHRGIHCVIDQDEEAQNKSVKI